MWLKGGQVYDVHNGTFTTMDVCIESGRFTKFGKAPAKGDDTIDLGGAFLLPGFIDCHVHICVNT